MLLSEAIRSGSISSTGVFTAQCTNEHGDVVESSIDLNNSLGNENGAFKYDFEDTSGFYRDFQILVQGSMHSFEIFLGLRERL
jgi:hypothetical protein